MLGRVEPRIFTPPRRDLSDPDASWGYDFIAFCELIGWPLDAWQRWLAVHLGELHEDGTPRFRLALVLVARQNGKSVFCRLLTLYWLFVERVALVIATNTGRDTAKASWKAVIGMAESNDLLAEALPTPHTRLQIGEEEFWTDYGSSYRFAAPNRRAGRSLTVNRAILDELREHRNRDVWDALIPTMNAVKGALAVCITNEGDDESVVLHEEYDAAADYAETGQGDDGTFLAAWSAPPGADPEDVEALAQANPDLGNRVQLAALLGQAIKAKRAGGETLARFRIEMMCQRVDLLDPAIEPELWERCRAAEPLDLAAHRRRVAIGFDVALDGTHATAVAACTIDGVTHVEVVGRWYGFGCAAALRRELPDLVERIKPRAVSWFPSGPAAAVAADLKARRGGNRAWPPRGVKVEELTAETAAVCMGLADVVHAGEVRHPGDDLLTTHVRQTQKLRRGDAWVFVRAGARPIDASYAMAAAVHTARTLPAPLGPVTVA